MTSVEHLILCRNQEMFFFLFSQLPLLSLKEYRYIRLSNRASSNSRTDTYKKSILLRKMAMAGKLEQPKPRRDIEIVDSGTLKIIK